MRLGSVRAAIYLVSALLAVEVGSQLICRQWLPPSEIIAVEDEVLGWRFLPICRNQKTKGYGDFDLCFNPNGFRSASAHSKIEAPIDLLVTGASVVLGQQVPLEATFASRLGGINGGFEGYTLRQISDAFVVETYSLHPKTVVLFLQLGLLEGEVASLRRIDDTLKNNPSIQRTAWVDSLWKNAGSLKLMRHLKKRARSSASIKTNSLPFVGRTSVEEAQYWQASIRAIVAKMTREKVILVVAPTRPELESYDPKSGPYDRTQQIMEFCDEDKLRCLDLFGPLFEAHRINGIFFDELHFNARGHEEVAAIIANILARNSKFSGD